MKLRRWLKFSMADYHFVYKDVEGASTQWDDIQRKLGNLPEKAPAFKPPAYTPAEDESSAPKDQAWFDKKTEEELEDLEDDKDLDDDRFLEEYRFIDRIEHSDFCIFNLNFVLENPCCGEILVCEFDFLGSVVM